MTPAPPVETTVNGRPAAAAPAAAAPTAAAPDVSALQKQIDDLKSELGETRRAAEFYEQRAREVPAPAAPAPAAKADDEEDVDVLEAITVRGAKGLDELLAKRGYVRGADVDKKVDARAASLLKEQELLGKYPDLKDKKSEFFRETAQAYGELIKAGVSPNVAMELSAERTELAFMREGKIKTPSETKAEKERDRKARAAAQGAEGTSRTPAHSEEDDTELTPEQKRIAKAMGITEEAYAARAKKGVAMKGIK